MNAAEARALMADDQAAVIGREELYLAFQTEFIDRIRRAATGKETRVIFRPTLETSSFWPRLRTYLIDNEYTVTEENQDPGCSVVSWAAR